MGFGDYNIQQGNGRKEKLGDIKQGIRREQIDAKLQNLFDTYDDNKDGCLEKSELDTIFQHLADFAGEDKTLDSVENGQINSQFKEKMNIENADFMGFVKSVSTASADIIETKEKQTPDGGKEVTTTYNDGTVETISYYPDGEFKFKKIVKNSVSVLSETQKTNASQALGNTPTVTVVASKKARAKIPNIENAIKELIEDGAAAADVAKKYKIDKNKLLEYYNSLLAPVSDDMLTFYGDEATFKKLRKYVANNAEITVATLNNENPEQQVTIVSHKTKNGNFYRAYDKYGDAITTKDLHDVFGITDVRATEDGAFRFVTDNSGSVKISQAATRQGNAVVYSTTLKDYLNTQAPQVSVAVSKKVGPVEFSQRAQAEIEIKQAILQHFVDSRQEVQEYLKSMGILDDIGASINVVFGGNILELLKKYQNTASQALRLNAAKSQMDADNSLYLNDFKETTGLNASTEACTKFYNTIMQYQNATILKDRIEILDKAMLEINAYQDDVKLQKQVGRQAQGLNTENHIANAKALLLQYFGGDQKAVNMLVDNNQPEAVIETIKGIKADTDKQYQSVLAGKKYDDVKADYQNQYKSIYGTDFVPDDLTDKVMDAKATGSFVKLAAITIVSILITRSPAMAQINGAIAGSAEATGAAANLMRTLVARYGQTAVAQGVKFAMTSGTLATDVGLTLLNQVTSERGFNGEELWESTKASAKFIYFGAYVGGPLAQAVSQRLGKIGVTAKMFKGGAKSANGAMQTTTIAGDKLMQNLVKGGNQILTKGGAFLTDVAAFTGLEVVTDGADLLAAGKEQLEFLPKLKIMNGIIEYVLGGRVHAGMVKAKMDAAIEQSGVKNWTIKEIKTPTKTMYEVEVAKGMPKARFANSNDLATAMLEAVAGKYEKLFNAAIGEKQKADTTPHHNPLPQGAREQSGAREQRKVREKGVKVLEGGVTADELTEVAPFARHLEDRVTDPIAILGSDMASRASKQSFDLSKYEQTGLPLKYSRREFTQKLKDLVNNMPIEEQQAILKKFNIELIYTGNSFELADIPKLPKNSELKTSLERQIKVEIENFVKNNEFQIDNAEMKAFLDDFIKVAPEFLLTVGKKQHATHEYTLDVHTLKVLQNTMEHPEYKNLSSEEKLILNMATMLHDIGKRFIDPKTPDQTHASNSQKYAISLLDRFNLDSNMKQRIVKLIENHEFFKDYNQVYTAYIAEQEYNTKNEQSAKENGWSYTPRQEWEKIFKDRVKYHAGQFANLQDARLAKILTFADLKSVNPDGKFTKTEFDKSNNNVEVEYNGFEKMVTSTHSNKEFQDYIDKSISFIETELASNKDGKIGDELVYATELKNTSKKLFGTDDFFERIACERNKQYGVHRSDYEYILNVRQQLLDAGVKAKDISNLLSKIIKYDNHFSIEKTDAFLKTYLNNKDFIASYDKSSRRRYSSVIDRFRNAEELQAFIDLETQQATLGKTFDEFGIKDSNDQKLLTNALYTEQKGGQKVFNKDAHSAMVELLKTKKYSTREVYSIITNSYSLNYHRWNLRSNDNAHSEFNKQLHNTILEFAKEESVDRAINDAQLCFVSATPESGWVLAPELLNAVKEFNKMGITNKKFISDLFDYNYKDGKNQHAQTRELESITKNEKYDRAKEFAKQGFEGHKLQIIVNTCEFINDKAVYSKEVQQKIAELVKRGVYEEFSSCQRIIENLFDYSYEGFGGQVRERKFNNDNYNFFIKMLDTGVDAKTLENIVIAAYSRPSYAEDAAPSKMLETGRFSKRKVEGLVNFFKEVGFDKIPYNYYESLNNIAESFMDIVELTPEESAKMVDYSFTAGIEFKLGKMDDGMAPFLYVNKDKYAKALDYYKKGVNLDAIKELTQNSSLYDNLKSEKDLSYIKTQGDALLVANFWNLKDVKSIEELSNSEKMNLMTEMMINKSAFENNNVSDRIQLLPKTSEGYAAMMKNLAHSFGFDKPAYSAQERTAIDTQISNVTNHLKNVKPSALDNDVAVANFVNTIKTLIPEITDVNVKTLYRVTNSAEFAELSSNDKKIVVLATLFSNTASTVRDTAISASVCAKRLGFSDKDATNIYTIVKNSFLVDDFMSHKKSIKQNDSRRYATILSSELDETFETAAMELKNYDNYKMAKIIYTANENFISVDMLKEYAPELYREFLSLRQSGASLEDALMKINNNPKNVDILEDIKIKAADKFAPSRRMNAALEAEIQRIKSSDVVLPQTDIQEFVSKQTPEWRTEHTKLVNGRKVLVITSDEIPNFFHLSHTTQAYAITGRADATTNISNFEGFAMLFDNKTVCCSYSGTGKVAFVGDTALLVKANNTSQYIARGTDISSIAKDVPTMISEYISTRASIEQKGFQSKTTKDFDRQYFASMIKEELQAGYRELLGKKLNLEEQIRNGNENVKTELMAVNKQMEKIDNIYANRLDALVKKANGKVIDFQFIRENDPVLANAYEKVLSYINTEHRGNDGLMRTEYHNEVLASNLKPVGITVKSEKALYELTDDYLKKAEDENWPIVILK